MAELTTKANLSAALKRQTLALTLRCGSLLVAALGALAMHVQLGV